MHEQSLTEKMLKIILDQAAMHGSRKITRVKMVVGDLSGIVPECVEEYFKLIADGTAAEGAVLEFAKAQATLFCPACNREFHKRPQDFLCPDCGGLARLTESGRECFVESIEVE